MSPPYRHVRLAKRQADRAIGEAYRRLASDRRARATFTALLRHVRERAPSLLRAPLVDGRHSGVETLVNLARVAHPHIRPIDAWDGSTAGWQGAVASLAQHLIARYRVPAFLAAAWYATDAFAEAKRRWYVAHASGSRFRSLDLPMCMSKRMEHLFLRSHAHVTIEAAMRRAEIAASGGDPPLIAAVLDTSLGEDLSNGPFWRGVIQLLIAYRADVELQDVSWLVRALQMVRHGYAYDDGSKRPWVRRAPPVPHLSVRGRTWRSLRQLARDWYDGTGTQFLDVSWERSAVRPMAGCVPRRVPGAPPMQWEIVELTTVRELRREAAVMRHCVKDHGVWCWFGNSHIWALRSRRGSAGRHLATIEECTEPPRTITALSGYRNRRVSGKARRFIERWAAREGLRMGS